MLKVSPTTGPHGHARSAAEEAGAARPLGKLPETLPRTVFVDHETGEVHEFDRSHDGTYRPHISAHQSRVNRWLRKSVVNRILPMSRVSKCLNWRQPIGGYGLAPIEIWRGKESGKAFYKGLLTCGDIWGCPCCAAKISQRRRLELETAMASASSLGWAVHFVTMTVPHGIGDDLDALLDALSSSLKKLSSGKHAIKRQLADRFPGSELHGYIRACEVTHGQNGWHPHFHLLVFTSPDLSSEDLRSIYLPAWQRACRLAGLPEPSVQHGVTVKDGSYADGYVSKWGLEDEMTKAHIKRARGEGATPFSLLDAILDEDDPIYPKPLATALFVQFTKSFKGRRQLFWSVGLRAKLGLASELSDAELAEESVDELDVLCATVQDDQWRAIRMRMQEPQLLNVAEVNPDALGTVIRSITESASRRKPDGAPLAGCQPCAVEAPMVHEQLQHHVATGESGAVASLAAIEQSLIAWIEYRNSYQKGGTHEEAANPLPAPRKVRPGRNRPDPDLHEDAPGGQSPGGQLGLQNLVSYAAIRE